MTINIVLTRKTSKQSWAQAATIELKDMSADRLATWIDAANSILGWKKYQAENSDHLIVDAGAINDGVVEPA